MASACCPGWLSGALVQQHLQYIVPSPTGSHRWLASPRISGPDRIGEAVGSQPRSSLMLRSSEAAGLSLSSTTVLSAPSQVES